MQKIRVIKVFRVVIALILLPILTVNLVKSTINYNFLISASSIFTSMIIKTQKNVESKKEEKPSGVIENVITHNTPSVAVEDLTIPEENRGNIVEKTYVVKEGGEYIGYKQGFLRNTTNLSNAEVKTLLGKEIDFKIKGNTSEPQVLIFSTHTTEAYEPFDRLNYDKSKSSSTLDANENVLAVGKVICDRLNEAGIGAVQANTVHDNPMYSGAYGRSRETIDKMLEMYPSIKVMLDIHRDSMQMDNTDRIKPVSIINGKKAAQIMIISGCDDGTLDFPNWRNNLSFATEIQAKMEEMFPTLTRPILFSHRRYNMNVMSGSLLFEMGSDANTLEEAKYSAELLSQSLIEVLKGITE